MVTITIDGVEYVKKEDNKPHVNVDGLPYVICRSCNAGVFAGYLKSRKGQECTLVNARRLWYWEGAASLSELAMEGVRLPENCKFPCEVSKVEMLDVCEILDVTERARRSIANVKVWTAAKE